jgi:outer membrane lipoprotein carrier protein
MERMTRHCLLIILWCLPNWLYAHEALDNFLHGLHTLYAQFEQHIYDDNGHLLETSQGKMYVRRPNKFRWDYQQPYNQLIVADGKRVWIYDSDLEQVTRKSLSNTLGKTPAFILSRKRAPEEDFFINNLPSYRRDVTRLELIPKDAQAQFDSMRLNLHGKTLLNLELVDNLGQTTNITFRQMRRNPSLSDKLFIFTPPKGVDIIKDN